MLISLMLGSTRIQTRNVWQPSACKPTSGPMLPTTASSLPHIFSQSPEVATTAPSARGCLRAGPLAAIDPEFGLVTGVSTGALSAPFAFLGREYDAKLKQVYTDTNAGDIFSKRSILAAVANDAMTDTTPLRNIIASFVDEAMIAQIAEEYAKGRLLLIMTTNLDQGRSVIWNIGAIAASEFPGKRDLIIDILRASAAIPGLFPPVMLDVSIDGSAIRRCMSMAGQLLKLSFIRRA